MVIGLVSQNTILCELNYYKILCRPAHKNFVLRVLITFLKFILGLFRHAVGRLQANSYKYYYLFGVICRTCKSFMVYTKMCECGHTPIMTRPDYYDILCYYHRLQYSGNSSKFWLGKQHGLHSFWFCPKEANKKVNFCPKSNFFWNISKIQSLLLKFWNFMQSYRYKYKVINWHRCYMLENSCLHVFLGEKVNIIA